MSSSELRGDQISSLHRISEKTAFRRYVLASAHPWTEEIHVNEKQYGFIEQMLIDGKLESDFRSHKIVIKKGVTSCV